MFTFACAMRIHKTGDLYEWSENKDKVLKDRIVAWDERTLTILASNLQKVNFTVSQILLIRQFSNLGPYSVRSSDIFQVESVKPSPFEKADDQ